MCGKEGAGKGGGISLATIQASVYIGWDWGNGVAGGGGGGASCNFVCNVAANDSPYLQVCIDLQKNPRSQNRRFLS